MQMYDLFLKKLEADLRLALLGTYEEETQRRLLMILKELDSLKIKSEIELTKNDELFALAYISKSNVDESNMVEECGKIISTAQLTNSKLGITGFLVYFSGYFIQYIEGGADSVDYLYGKIVLDSRHSNFRLLHRGKAKDRVFPLWSMAYSIATQKEDDLIDSILKEKIFNETRLLKSEEVLNLLDFMKNIGSSH